MSDLSPFTNAGTCVSRFDDKSMRSMRSTRSANMVPFSAGGWLVGGSGANPDDALRDGGADTGAETDADTEADDDAGDNDDGDNDDIAGAAPRCAAMSPSRVSTSVTFDSSACSRSSTDISSVRLKQRGSHFQKPTKQNSFSTQQMNDVKKV